MPNSKTVTGSRWKTCDRCGFDYPLHRLRKQDGYWLCQDMCTDKHGRDYYLSKLVVEGELRGANQEEAKEETFSDI